MNRRLAEIGVDQHDLLADVGVCNRQIDGRRRLALPMSAGGHRNSLHTAVESRRFDVES
ncbi:hypothetical protein D3C73_1443970 [compost metagenome]